MKFKELLKEKNITQTELANRMGTYQQKINYWITGGSPDLKYLPKLAEVLGTSVEEIINCFRN